MTTLTSATETIRDGERADELLWVKKSYHTLPLAKRKDVCPEPSGWSLCPASADGGCCPDNFSCGSKLCYATTAGPTSCGGSFGYYGCPFSAGGNCCPVGFICGDQQCLPPPDSDKTITCSENSFNCPQSLGGGCCASGRVCGMGICWADTPTILPVSETVTTTDPRGKTVTTVVTSTTTFIDAPGTSSLAASAMAIPQFVPSTVTKIPAIHTGGSSSSSDGNHGGLSDGALGGIVAGVVIILLILIAIATFVVLRLRKAERAEKAEKATKPAEYERESNSQVPPYNKSHSGHHSISEIDSTVDTDGFTHFPIMRPSPSTLVPEDASPSRTSRFSGSTNSSPHMWGMPFGHNGFDGRHSLIDSMTGPDGRPMQRISISSYGSPSHSRHASDTSELEGPHGVSELSTNANNSDARQRANSQQRPAKTQLRRNSDLAGNIRRRSDSGTLGTVTEAYELHGHYGPVHEMAGQTDAGLPHPSSGDSERDS